VSRVLRTDAGREHCPFHPLGRHTTRILGRLHRSHAHLAGLAAKVDTRRNGAADWHRTHWRLYAFTVTSTATRTRKNVRGLPLAVIRTGYIGWRRLRRT
jgi:hypothetical protein